MIAGDGYEYTPGRAHIMLLHSQFSTRFVRTSTRPPVRRITYTRYMGRNFILTGVILEERQVEVRRWPGITVTEYRVRPTKGQSNLSEHWVNEADVLTISDVRMLKPICPRCGDHGYLSIVHDLDTPCPVCNVSDDEVTF